MVSSSMIAVLLSFGLVAQAPGVPQGWVVVEPKEGGFSVAMPAKPIEQSQEVPTQIGKVMAKFYVCKVANGARRRSARSSRELSLRSITWRNSRPGSRPG